MFPTGVCRTATAKLGLLNIIVFILLSDIYSVMYYKIILVSNLLEIRQDGHFKWNFLSEIICGVSFHGMKNDPGLTVLYCVVTGGKDEKRQAALGQTCTLRNVHK